MKTSFRIFIEIVTLFFISRLGCKTRWKIPIWPDALLHFERSADSVNWEFLEIYRSEINLNRRSERETRMFLNGKLPILWFLLPFFCSLAGFCDSQKKPAANRVDSLYWIIHRNRAEINKSHTRENIFVDNRASFFFLSFVSFFSPSLSPSLVCRSSNSPFNCKFTAECSEICCRYAREGEREAASLVILAGDESASADRKTHPDNAQTIFSLSILYFRFQPHPRPT